MVCIFFFINFHVKENCKIAKTCRKTNENLLNFSLNRPYFKNFYVKLSSKFKILRNNCYRCNKCFKKRKKTKCNYFWLYFIPGAPCRCALNVSYYRLAFCVINRHLLVNILILRVYRTLVIKDACLIKLFSRFYYLIAKKKSIDVFRSKFFRF